MQDTVEAPINRKAIQISCQFALKRFNIAFALLGVMKFQYDEIGVMDNELFDHLLEVMLGIQRELTTTVELLTPDDIPF